MLTPLLNPEQVAEYLGIRVKTVHQLVRDGALSCFQVTPKDRRFTEDQIRDYLQSRTINRPQPTVDRLAPKRIPSPRKGGGVRKSQRVDETGLLREEIKKLCR